MIEDLHDKLNRVLARQEIILHALNETKKQDR